MKRYRSFILIMLPLLVLVLYWQFGRKHFRNDARQLAGPSMGDTNIISPDQLSSLSGKKLIIFLDSCKTEPDVQQLSTRNIPAANILTDKSIRLLRNHDGPVILYSCTPSLSARIWMLLSQMGIRKVYILYKK